jgi:hypothetical protein
MEFFIPYPLASNSIWLITKYQMPLGMSEQQKFNFYEMVDPKNKIGLFQSYLYSLSLTTFNLLIYLSKPTYLIGFNNYT